MRVGLKIALLIGAGLWFGACAPSADNSGDGFGATPTMQGPSETPYCGTAQSYSKSVTINGHAQFNRREPFGNSVSGGLGSADPAASSHPASVHPIRYAEIRVTNSLGDVIQCAETDGNGDYSFTLPQSNSTFTISINSRSAPSSLNTGGVAHLYGSILNRPDLNQFYSLTATVFAANSVTMPTATAAANGDVLAAAFNIMDQLENANAFLVAQVGTCASVFTGCSNYDPAAHKITAYWQKGFNPNDYFGSGGGGLSFYLPGYSRLFILGGVGGDVNSSDTDHFDSSVIVHEYGHFMEDNWLKTDSPGGSHDGNELLDPRLAWSEGWADFFQAAVHRWYCTNNPSDAACAFDHFYTDTVGNVDGVTDLAFYVDTETVTAGGFDYTANLGEGNFREFSITRYLFDAFDDTPAETQFTFTDNIKDAFNQIWAAASKAQYGFRDPTYMFRNVGLLSLSQIWLFNHNGGSDWTSIRGLNRQDGNTSHYAQYLVPSDTGTCASSASINPSNAFVTGNTYYFSISPTTDANPSLAASNLFVNNRFYHLHVNAAGSATHPSAGNHTLKLSYEDDDGLGTAADLDLYVYDREARFAVTADMIGYSRNTPTGTNPERVLQTETVTVNLPAGDYLINVNAYTGNAAGGQADYNLLLDGVVLCPANLVPP